MSEAPPGVDAPRQSVGALRALGASLYEGLLLLAIVFALTFVAVAITSPSHPSGSAPLALPSHRERALTFTAIVVLCGAYCGFYWSNGRRSLAMKTWQLELRTRAGEPLTIARALGRYALWWIGPACGLAVAALLRGDGHLRWAWPFFFVTYAWAFVDRDRRFLHDRLAQTRLERRNRPR